jgi:hypothetical protein
MQAAGIDTFHNQLHLNSALYFLPCNGLYSKAIKSQGGTKSLFKYDSNVWR